VLVLVLVQKGREQLVMWVLLAQALAVPRRAG
jgi:hypothetical protein